MQSETNSSAATTGGVHGRLPASARRSAAVRIRGATTAPGSLGKPLSG
ncbi:hypothetical protein [Streptomyces sp. NPDC047973]